MLFLTVKHDTTLLWNAYLGNKSERWVFCISKCGFIEQADAPNTGLIPESDAVGVTVVLITCTYRGQEFIRIGYYVNNEYTDPDLRENPPVKPDYTQVSPSKWNVMLLYIFLLMMV